MVSPSLWRVSRLVMAREFELALRHWDEVLQPLIFFAVVATLFPLAIGPSLEQLRQIAPGVVWVAAMLAALLAAESMFRADVDDGTMEQWALSGQPLAWLLFVKTLSHWLIAGLPIVIASPIVGTVLGLASVGLGSLALNVFGAIGAALTVSVRRGSVLLALLVLPLEMPILNFGARAIDMALHGETAAGPLN